MGRLQVLEDKKFIRAKTILEIVKNSERVTINYDNEVINVDKVQTGLKAGVFLYDIQQPTKKPHNPAFIVILTALNLNEKLVKNQNSQHVVQSASFNPQERREPGPSRTHPASPAWQARSSANLTRSKKNKKEKAIATIENPKPNREKESEEGSHSYGTPYSNSDSPTSGKTKTKTKQWENYQGLRKIDEN